jgi:hypothetical protein
MKQTWWIEISLADRGMTAAQAKQFRNAIEDQIEPTGIGQVVGGGCAKDGSSIDLELEVHNPFEAEGFIFALLDSCDLRENTTVRVEE